MNATATPKAVKSPTARSPADSSEIAELSASLIESDRYKL